MIVIAVHFYKKYKDFAKIDGNLLLWAGILSEGRFFKMKKHKVFLLLGMLVLALVFAFGLVGCDTDTGGDGTGTENTGGGDTTGGNDGNNTGGSDNTGGNDDNNTGGSDNTGGNGGDNTDGGTTAIPSVPAGVTATALSASSISISWSTVSGATSYKVYYEIGSSNTKNLAGTATGTSYTHTGLEANTAYCYYIKAINSAGESGYSAYSSSASATTFSGGSSGNTGGNTGGGTATEYRLDQPIFGTCTKSGNNITIRWTLTTSGKTSNGLYTYTSPSNIIIQVTAVRFNHNRPSKKS
jgi:hypothetical protein